MTTGPEQDGARKAGEPMKAAVEPRGVSGAVVWGMLWALLFAALGLVAVREGLLNLGQFGGRPELPPLLAELDGQSFQPLIGGVGVVLVLLGLLMLVAAVRRRPRRAYRLGTRTGVYLRYREAARIAELTAGEVPGVLSARATPSRRHLRVTVATTGAPTIGDEVQQLLTARLAALATPPTVKVRANATGRQSQASPGPAAVGASGAGTVTLTKEDGA